MEMESRTYIEIEEYIKKNKAAILPVGAIEAHGPHLPVGTDNYLAEEISKRVAEKTDALVLPNIPYGQVWSLKNAAGSIYIRNDTLKNIIKDIGKSLYHQGIKIMAVINAHLGNNTAVKEAARELYEEVPGLKVYYFFYNGAQKVIDEVRQSKAITGGYFHACELETSYMLYLCPQYVNMDKAILSYPNFTPDFECTPTPWEYVTDTYVLGDATLATKEKGEKIINAVIEKISDILNNDKA